MAIIDQLVAASLDDVYEKESDGGITWTTDYIQHSSAAVATSRFWGGHRWVASIPKDVIISVAYVKLNIIWADYDDANWNIHFEKAASPPIFTTDAYNVTSRTRTTASTPWIANSLGTGWVQSPSLVTPLQELVNAYAVDAIVIITRPNLDVTKWLLSHSWDGNPTLAANLHVEYAIPGVGRSFGFIIG